MNFFKKLVKPVIKVAGLATNPSGALAKALGVNNLVGKMGKTLGIGKDLESIMGIATNPSGSLEEALDPKNKYGLKNKYIKRTLHL